MGWRSTGAELRSSRGGSRARTARTGGVGAVPPCARAGASGSGAERHAGAGRGAGRPCVWKLAPQDPPFNLIQLIFELKKR